MNNEEWLAWRRKGIGATDACVIMGVSPWRTPHQLWQDKVYGDSVQLENASMTRGKELEAVARQLFEETMRVTVFPKNVVSQSADWIRASLDGIDMEGRVMVEIKCPNREDHASALNKKVPEKYWPQVQHQLLVTGLDGMYYYSFDGSKGAIVEVARDDHYIQAMLQEEQKFWDKVLAKEPVPLTDRDFVSMENDPQWQAWAKQWAENKEALRIAEEKEKETREKLISLSNDRNSHGSGLKISKSICPGTVDYRQAILDYIAKLQSAYPEVVLPALDLDSYRKKPFTKWTFRVT